MLSMLAFAGQIICGDKLFVIAKEILEKSDVLKFSGQQVSNTEYELIYGTAEKILKDSKPIENSEDNKE